MIVALALPVSLLLSACGEPSRKTPAAAVSPSPSASLVSPSAAPLALAIIPAAEATNLPVTTEIGMTVTGGTVTDVALVDGAGKRMAGEMRADGSSWVPAAPLAFGA